MDNLESQLNLINYQLCSLNNALYLNYPELLQIYSNNNGINIDYLDTFEQTSEYRNLIELPSNDEIDNILTLISENEMLKFDSIDYEQLDESLLNFGTKNNENLQEIFKDINVTTEEVKVDNKEIIEVIEKGNKTTNLLLSILIGALVITTFFKNIFR